MSKNHPHLTHVLTPPKAHRPSHAQSTVGTWRIGDICYSATANGHGAAAHKTHRAQGAAHPVIAQSASRARFAIQRRRRRRRRLISSPNVISNACPIDSSMGVCAVCGNWVSRLSGWNIFGPTDGQLFAVPGGLHNIFHRESKAECVYGYEGKDRVSGSWIFFCARMLYIWFCVSRGMIPSPGIGEFRLYMLHLLRVVGVLLFWEGRLIDRALHEGYNWWILINRINGNISHCVSHVLNANQDRYYLPELTPFFVIEVVNISHCISFVLLCINNKRTQTCIMAIRGMGL